MVSFGKRNTSLLKWQYLTIFSYKTTIHKPLTTFLFIATLLQQKIYINLEKF